MYLSIQTRTEYHFKHIVKVFEFRLYSIIFLTELEKCLPAMVLFEFYFSKIGQIIKWMKASCSNTVYISIYSLAID